LTKNVAAKKAPAKKAATSRKEQLRQYKQDQRDRDAASGITLIQPRVKASTKTFLENYRDTGGFESIGAALDAFVESVGGESKSRKKGK